MAFFNEDAQMFSPMGTYPARLDGRAAIGKQFASILKPSRAQPGGTLKIEPHDVDVRDSAPSRADHVSSEDAGPAASAIVRDDARPGGWRIAHIHASIASPCFQSEVYDHAAARQSRIHNRGCWSRNRTRGRHSLSRRRRQRRNHRRASARTGETAEQLSKQFNREVLGIVVDVTVASRLTTRSRRPPTNSGASTSCSTMPASTSSNRSGKSRTRPGTW